MRALIVVSHPNPKSLTHAVATQIAEGITSPDRGNGCEIADLAAEGFDPRFTTTDLAVLAREATPAADVSAEHARLDAADALVLVYPVYWWSMPALLKGWIDRVFTNGWAYDELPGQKLVKKLHRLPIHLIALAGADAQTYTRHGYFDAMKTQIDHGIFDFCGAPVVSSTILHQSDANFPDSHFETARTIGRHLFKRAITGDQTG